MALKNSRRVISPTRIEDIKQSELSYLMNRFIMKRYQTDLLRGGTESVVGTVENLDGKHIHKALQDSFDFLKTVKNPSSKEINNHLHHAFKLAEKSLQTSGVSVSEHRNFMKSVIDEYGGMALSKRSLGAGSLDIMPEMPVLMPVEMSIDKALAGNWKANPIGTVVRGSSDLAIVDTAKKVGTIVDYKNLFDANSAEILKKKIAQGEVWQPKMYALAMFNMYTEDELDKIHFYYEMNKPGKDGRRMREKLFVETFHRKQVDSIQFEVMEEIAKLESMQHTVYNTMRAGDMNALRKYIAGNMGKAGCTPPHSCSFCPLKRTCTHGPFASKVLHPDEAIKGSETTTTKIRKLKGYMDPEFVKKHSDIYDKKAKGEIDEYIQRKTAELKGKGYKGHEIDKRIASEAKLLEESSQVLKRYTRGQYVDSATGSAISARTKIPFSIIDSEYIHAGWLSKKSRSALASLSRDRIKEVSSALDVKHELVTDRVLDRVFKDDEFAARLEDYMAGKYRDAIKKHGLPYTNESIRKLQMRPDLVMDKYLAETLQGEIDRATVGEILRQDSGNIEKYLKKIDPKRLQTEVNLESITKGFVDSGVIKKNPDLFLQQLAKGGSVNAIKEKFRLSAHKFPLTTAMATFFLSYLAGTSTIQSTVMRKIEKATEYMTGQQDNKVRDGQHSSAYTTARRLLLSDFGSARRFLNPRSGLISNIITSISSKMKAFIDAGIVTKGLAGTGATEAIETSGGRTLRNFMENLGESPAGAAAAFVGASAAAFLITGPGVNVKTDRDIGREYRDRNKRFKRIKRGTWNKDSAMLEKESKLREAYKLHTNFGSGVFQVARQLQTVALEYMNPTALEKLWNNFRGELQGSFKYFRDMINDKYTRVQHLWDTRNDTRKAKDALSSIIDSARQQVEVYASKFRGTNLKDDVRKLIYKENREHLAESGKLQKAFDRGLITISAVNAVPSGTSKAGSTPLISDKSLLGKGTHGRQTVATRVARRNRDVRKYYTDESFLQEMNGQEYRYYLPGRKFTMPTSPARGMSEYVPYRLESSGYPGVNYDLYKGSQTDIGSWYSAMKGKGNGGQVYVQQIATSSQPAYYSTAEQFTTKRVNKYNNGDRKARTVPGEKYSDIEGGDNYKRDRQRKARYLNAVTMDTSGILKSRKYSYGQSGGTLFFDAINSLNGVGIY